MVRQSELFGDASHQVSVLNEMIQDESSVQCIRTFHKTWVLLLHVKYINGRNTYKVDCRGTD